MSDKLTVNAYNALGAFDELGIEYLGNWDDREVRIHCRLHDDRNPSCRVTTDTGVWFCDPCAQGGDFPKLLRTLGIVGMQYGQLLSKHSLGEVELEGSGRRKGNIAVIDPNWVVLPGRLAPSPEKARYKYEDEYGRHVATVHRDGKNFPVQHLRGWPKRSDGLEYVWGHPDTWVLYRLPEVLRAVEAEEPVYVCEGEKDADALRTLGVTATTCAGGAGKHGKTDLQPLRGAEVKVIIVADRDAPGLNHAASLAAALRRWGSIVTIVGSAAGKDAADHIANGFGIDDFIEWHEPLLPRLPDGMSASGESGSSELGVYVIPANGRRRKRIDWLWRNVIPRGSVVGFYGNEGLGKSCFTAFLASQLSLGYVGDRGPEGVLIVSYEDDIDPVWLPRLQAAGADMSRIGFIAVKTEDGIDRDLVLPLDIEGLRAAVAANDVGMIIIDPITVSMDMALDAHKGQDVRHVVNHLKAIASEHDVAFVCIGHFNRNGGSSARDRVGGSIAWRKVFRSAFGLFMHPDDDPAESKRRILHHDKSNYGPKDSQMEFYLTSVELPEDPETGEPSTVVPIVARLQPVSEEDRLTEQQLFAGPRKEKPSTKLDEAIEWLGQILTGGPMSAGEVARFATEAGISKGTLDRAANELRVNKVRLPGKDSGWQWSLPHDEHEPGTNND